MNYVTNTFLLVISSARSKQLLCFVQDQGQKREQKHTTKNFVEFHNHSLYYYDDFWLASKYHSPTDVAGKDQFDLKHFVASAVKYLLVLKEIK